MLKKVEYPTVNREISNTVTENVLRPLFKLSLPSTIASQFYNKYFGDLPVDTANSLLVHTRKGLGIPPSEILSRNKEDVSWILNFFKDLAKDHGSIVGPTTDPSKKRKGIRLYGYRLGSSGLQHASGVGPIGFFPDAGIDIDNFGSGLQNRYFEIIYNEETGEIEGFSLEDFKILLGALFADHQTFIVRTSPDIVGNTMPNDKIIMGFNIFSLGLIAEQIPGGNGDVCPTTENGVLTAYEQAVHDLLVQRWSEFLLRKRLYFFDVGYKVWMQNMMHVSYFNERQTQDINQLLPKETRESQEPQDL